MTDERTPTGSWRAPLALLLLRLGLGWFLLVWAINKLLAPKQTEAIWGYFYGIEIGDRAPYALGAAEIVLALAIILGVLRPLSYAIGFLVHGVTVAVISGQLFAPFVIEDGFPVNRNISVAVPVLMAFAALWLLRAHDRWSVDALIARRRAP